MTPTRLGIVGTLSAWSREFGIDRETLRRRLADAKVEPSVQGRHPLYLARDVIKAVLAAEPRDPASMSPFERRAHFQAQREEMRFAEERGELLSRIEVEGEFARLFEAFVRFAETLPDYLERDGEATPAQLAKIETLLDKLRDEVANDVVATGTRETTHADRAAT